MSWQWPVAEPVVVTSSFNPARYNPVTGKVQPHNGTDFRAREGAPLYAAARGTVTTVTRTDLTGNYVRIQVDGSTWIGYSHLSRTIVHRGDVVSAGQLIGYAGSTGSATAAHLHFEVSVNGVKVDPVPFLSARVARPPVPLPPPVPTKKGTPMLLALDDLGRGRMLYTDGSWTFIRSRTLYDHLINVAKLPDLGKLNAQDTADVFAGVRRSAP